MISYDDNYVIYEKEYSETKKIIKDALIEGDVLKTISLLRYITTGYYTINYTYMDDELEDILFKVSSLLLGTTEIRIINNNSIIFYDGFGLLNRGLCTIYVEALVRIGYEVIWILYEYEPDTKQIVEKYECQGVKFIVIPKSNILNRMKVLRDIVKDISPFAIMIYTTPYDVAGLGVLSTLSGNTKRFLIDLTDHAYWIGKKSFDVLIGFRNIGYNIAVSYRGIDEDKICILPYYPQKREKKEFEGMPFDLGEYSYVFSGGSAYKIEGDNKFEKIVRHILQYHSSTNFVYASNDTNPIIEGLKKRYENRFFHIRERQDLDEVMKHSRLYLSTYPIHGGLMEQYAVSNYVPLVCLIDGIDSVDDCDMFLDSERMNFQFYSINDLYKEVDRILKDEEYCNEIRKHMHGQLISEERFERELKSILECGVSSFKGYRKAYDIDGFLKLYKKNADMEMFRKLVRESRNRWVYDRHPEIVKEANG